VTEDQNTIANQTQTENIVKRILTSEVKYFIGVIIFLTGVVAPYYSIRQEIAIIKENHFSHMEAMAKQIEQNSIDIKRLEETEITLMKTIAENSVRIKNLEK
jgi:hypothetical protein